MNSSDHTTWFNTTWFNTIVGLGSIVVGVIGMMPAEFSFPRVQWEIFSISFALFLFAILAKFFKRLYLEWRLEVGKASLNVAPSNTSTTNFTAQLGNSQNPGFLPKAQRLTQIKPGQNPYVCGSSLRGNSAVFYGRRRELEGTLSVLRNPEKPGDISILGERRIGKSSLLNQIYQALAAEPNVVSIYTTMQNWSIDSQATFFTQLHQVICDALKIQPSSTVDDYARFRDFILDYAKKGYRFVLMIDEFERMTGNKYFDAQFFSNMRTLSNNGDYKFGYVLASRQPLQDICEQGKIEESGFYNIFGTSHLLGLLDQKEAAQLIQEPMQRSLGYHFEQSQEIFNYAGYHPAFIQIVASEYWIARHHGFAVNRAAFERVLQGHYQYLWQHRTETERKLLLKIAKHEIPKNNATLEKLRQRGLVGADNQLFARFFGQVFEKPSTTD
jgi:hypothetical protein